jgi:uncharacterized membrane protein YraQ (UPF0718 family)
MFAPIFEIIQFIIEAFLHIWPYLLVTIPLAVAVQMSGASKYIKRAFETRPLTAILLATLVGAFSPFCSCGVIPVIASLLISGVPLAPVMSFWMASPSMDPEIFFLSVGMIGWKLAIWRLAATLILSLSAGFITHMLVQNGWLGQQILRARKAPQVKSTRELLKKNWDKFKAGFAATPLSKYPIRSVVPHSNAQLQFMPVVQSAKSSSAADCSSCSSGIIPKKRPQPARAELLNVSIRDDSCNSGDQNCGCNSTLNTFWQRLFKETLSATAMVVKFMALAFFLEALIILYVPQEWISAALGQNNPMAIATAAILGVPTYTSSLTALPMISGLLTQGMNPAAALAFLIAGPTTTLPAMAAVWPLVARRVFVIYVSFALLGAVLMGYLYEPVSKIGFWFKIAAGPSF